MSAVSAADAWAVGIYNTNKVKPFIVHWNGVRWTEVRSPRPAGVTGDTALLGVSTIASDDAWAAGYTSSGDGATFLLHWNGTRWARVCTPTPPSPSPGQASTWKPFSPGCTGTLIQHWDGTHWTKVPSPY